MAYGDAFNLTPAEKARVEAAVEADRQKRREAEIQAVINNAIANDRKKNPSGK